MNKLITMMRPFILVLSMLLLLPLGTQAQKVRYVKSGASGDGSSWSNASGDLQTMIDQSTSGDEVWIASGTYKPTRLIKSTKKNSRAFHLKDGVSLIGGFEGTETSKTDRKLKANGRPYEFAHETILSGDDDVQDTWTRGIAPGSSYRYIWEIEGNKGNANHVLYGGKKVVFNDRTEISGLTIEGGNADTWNVQSQGAGLMAAGNVQVKKCIFRHNYAFTGVEGAIDFLGGAVSLTEGKGKSVVEDCLFEENMSLMTNLSSYGGGLYIDNGTVKNCYFKGCVSGDFGGAVYAKNSKVINCIVEDSYSAAGGGIYLNKSTIENSRVSHCRGLKGAGIYNEGGTVHHTFVYGNYAVASEYQTLGGGQGASIFNEGGKVIGCVIYNGTADTGGGIASLGGAVYHSTIQNCQSNVVGIDPNLYTYKGKEGAPEVKIVNTICENDVAASNFIKPTTFNGWAEDSQSEQFAQIKDASFALTPNSIFVDKGEQTSEIVETKDILGNNRVSGTAIDKGAIELQQTKDPQDNPDILFTFKDNSEVTIGLGGTANTSFEYDFGDGKQKVEGAKMITGTPINKQLKIYGKQVMLIKANLANITDVQLNDAPALTKCFLAGNEISSLDLSHCPNIRSIYCAENKITNINLTNANKLMVIDCPRNMIAGTLDLTNLNELVNLKLFNNKLTELKLPKQDKLIQVDCDSNMLNTLDLTGITKLNELNCASNKLTSINLADNTELQKINASDNNITAVNLSALTKLTSCNLSINKINQIDLSKNTGLEDLYLQNNQLATIDLSKNSNIKWLNLDHNNLTEIDYSALPNLMQVRIAYNKLSTIDLSKNTKVNTVMVQHNNLSELNVAKQTNMFWLVCGNNKLTKLDLSANNNISWLECDSNQITALSVENMNNLQKLYCHNNAITNLDLSKNKNIEGLRVDDNKLTLDNLNSILNGLKDVKNLKIHDNNKEWAKIVNVSNNPGTTSLNDAKVAAEAKGWTVIALNDTSAQMPQATQVKIYFDNATQTVIASEKIFGVTVYNLAGQPILKMDEAEQISLNELPDQMYILIAIDREGNKITLKLIKK